MTALSHRSKIIVAFTALYALWGSTFLFIRFAIETIPPIVMSGVRFAVAGGALVAWALARGATPPTMREWRWATLIGTLMLALGNFAVVWSELRIASGLAALVIGSMPIWLVILDAMSPGGKRPAAPVVAGIVIGLAGVALLVDPSPGAGHATVALVVVLTGGAIAWAVGSILSRYAPQPDAPLLATGIQMLCGGAVLLIAAASTGDLSSLHVSQVTVKSALSLLYLTVFGSIIGFTAYIWLLKNVAMAKVATYSYVNPLIAVALGWAIAGERVTPRIITAALVILSSVALITVRGGSRRKPDDHVSATASSNDFARR